MPLIVTVEQKQPGVCVVSIVGSIDSETYVDLERELSPLLTLPPRVLIFDMGGVQFISSMGLSVVFKTRTLLQRTHCTFMLVNLQPHVKKVFEIIHTPADLSIFASMQEADRYLARLEQPGPGA